jgi:hypothetical protein
MVTLEESRSLVVKELVAHINVGASFDATALRGQGRSGLVVVTHTVEPRELGIKRISNSPDVSL